MLEEPNETARSETACDEPADFDEWWKRIQDKNDAIVQQFTSALPPVTPYVPPWQRP
jgi:hypothetical protein